VCVLFETICIYSILHIVKVRDRQMHKFLRCTKESSRIEVCADISMFAHLYGTVSLWSFLQLATLVREIT